MTGTKTSWMLIWAIIIVAGCTAAVVGLPLNEYAQGIITLVIGRFLGYIDNGYAFEFGTTRGSQNKDSTIAALAITVPADPVVTEGEKK